jgi:asparagine synthase (glutamine-hydrolysing)
VVSAPEDMGSGRWTTIFGTPALGRLMPDTGGTGQLPRYLRQLVDRVQALRRHTSPWEASVAVDLCFWLPDDLLVKVDRMTMAHSVEARAPFLDHVLVEKALRMPTRWKVDGNRGKIVLREFLRKALPAEVATRIADRRKHGFDVPLREWLKGPLRELAEDHFYGNSLRESGLIDIPYVQVLWRDFLANGGSVSFARKIWLLLCFALWHEHHRRKFGQ